MPLGTGAGALSSASVFHSPQASQRPAHLAWTAPQLWQTYCVSGRAMKGWLLPIEGTGQHDARLSIARAALPRRAP